MSDSRITGAEAVIRSAVQSGKDAHHVATLLETAGCLQTPGEVRDLYTRLHGTQAAVERAHARVEELQHAWETTLVARLVLQMQRDGAMRALAGHSLVRSCDRCQCTEDHACDGGCSWVPNRHGIDVCSGCLTEDGRCTTPHCGTYGHDDIPPQGWILVDIAGSTEPSRYRCSPWCAQIALQRIGMEMADTDRAAAAATVLEKDTRDSASRTGESTPAPLVVDRFEMADPESTPDGDEALRILAAAQDGRPVVLVLDADTRARVASWLGHPLRAYLTRYDHAPAPMGWYGTEAGARAHCEAELAAEHPGGTPPVPDWITDEEDGVAELVATFGKGKETTGYHVVAIDLPAAYDPEATW
ncbi:hypothetical protein [Streptomyces zhihengii]|uniref:Uncharacterized protein n=1 Tax=Streptomyces zhihengii TaxID=1818004 RepID=A0ABS2UU23_9ACTN|nr:hypothetical protein [Streptomyces zhihengii]MBM9620994.1 hypothetical protein [Streptomyces zhihengii]